MAMTYNSLTGAKGTSGAIATWVSYTRLDIPVIVDEAQAIIYGEGRLRAREMMTEFPFFLSANQAYVPLPSGFLDPIGAILCPTFNTRITHKDFGYVQANRSYTETTGTLGANPFTTSSGSNTVTVNLPNHGTSQDSPIYLSGATAFNGVTLNGTFPINGITDANNFTIDISILGTTPNASGSGGGSAVNYVLDTLTIGTPQFFGIWNERIYFDQAVFQPQMCRLGYYQGLPLLSSTNQTNFLTNRYPNLMRVACEAAAADFMKDSEEYEKHVGRLQALVQSISVENDMQYRGLEIEADTP